MELYIKISFWLGVITIVLISIIMVGSTYPRTSRHSLGEDTVSLILNIAIAVWAGILLFA